MHTISLSFAFLHDAIYMYEVSKKCAMLQSNVALSSLLQTELKSYPHFTGLQIHSNVNANANIFHIPITFTYMVF